MAEPRVRPACPGDGPACAAVWVDIGRYYHAIDPHTFQVPGSDGLADAFEQDIADACPLDLRLVAEVGGAVAGFLVAAVREPDPHPQRQLLRDLSCRRLFVEILAVAGPHRRGGAGTALMTAAERWAFEHGVAIIALDTYLHSPTSVPFYENRMGYTRRAVIFRKEVTPSSRSAPSGPSTRSGPSGPSTCG